MKKFLCLLALASGVSLIGMQSATMTIKEKKFISFEAPNEKIIKDKKTALEKLPNYDLVSLQSQDGHYFVVQKSLAILSETIKNLMQDANPDDVIPLPNITGKILAKIIGCTKNIKNGTPIDLKDESDEDLAGITLAANYLDIRIPTEGASPAESFLQKYAIPECAQRMFDAHFDKLKNATMYAIYKRLFLNPLNAIPDVRRLILNQAWPTLVSKLTIPLATFPHNGPVWAVAFSPNGKYIATGSLDKTAKLWKNEQAQNPQPLAILPHDSTVMAVAFSPNGHYIATGSLDKTAKLWKNELTLNPQPIATFPHNGEVHAVAFSPNGKHIATASDDTNAKLWKIEQDQNPQPIATFPHNKTVTSIAFSPDGHYIATASLDKTVKLWKIEQDQNPQLIATFPHNKAVMAVTFSPDGHFILSASGDKTAKLWKIGSNQNPQPFAIFPHNDKVSAVAFNPNGRYIATASWDKTAKLWRVGEDQNPQPITTLPHDQAVESVAFSSDGHSIATASDTIARLWRFSTLNIAAVDLNKLDLASAQIIIYILRNDIRTFNKISHYLRDALNPYAREFLEKNM